MTYDHDDRRYFEREAERELLATGKYILASEARPAPTQANEAPMTDQKAIEWTESDGTACRMAVYRQPGDYHATQATPADIAAAGYVPAAECERLRAELAELRGQVVWGLRITYPRQSVGLSDDAVFAKWRDGLIEQGWTPEAKP